MTFCACLRTPGSGVLSAVVAWTPHVCVQGWVDRSGVRGLCRIPGSDLTLAARPGWTHSVVLQVSSASLSCVLRHRGLPEGRVGGVAEYRGSHRRFRVGRWRSRTGHCQEFRAFSARSARAFFNSSRRPVRTKRCLGFGTGQQLVKHGVGDLEFFASWHIGSSLLPLCRPQTRKSRQSPRTVPQ